MFDNIGSKIKTLAKVLCWLGIILSVISGIATIAAGANSGTSYNRYGYSSGSIAGVGVLGGILIIVLGCLGSWIGSFFMYGFGQLIENSDIIASNSKSRG